MQKPLLIAQINVQLITTRFIENFVFVITLSYENKSQKNWKFLWYSY